MGWTAPGICSPPHSLSPHSLPPPCHLQCGCRRCLLKHSQRVGGGYQFGQCNAIRSVVCDLITNLSRKLRGFTFPAHCSHEAPPDRVEECVQAPVVLVFARAAMRFALLLLQMLLMLLRGCCRCFTPGTRRTPCSGIATRRHWRVVDTLDEPQPGVGRGGKGACQLISSAGSRSKSMVPFAPYGCSSLRRWALQDTHQDTSSRREPRTWRLHPS